jgi:uridine kinase
MRGDKILIEEHHRSVADEIAAGIIDRVRAADRRFTVTVAGESGSGKSETAQALADALGDRGVSAIVLQQDDYYVLPPISNDRARRANFKWVGTTEVRLDLLDEHLAAARAGESSVMKPLVIYAEDRIDSETIEFGDALVVIAEGVYTSLLEEVDLRVFIARNRLETLEHRTKRGREAIEPFIESVLELEHEIISQHRTRADIIISREYDVEFVEA